MSELAHHEGPRFLAQQLLLRRQGRKAFVKVIDQLANDPAGGLLGIRRCLCGKHEDDAHPGHHQHPEHHAQPPLFSSRYIPLPSLVFSQYTEVELKRQPAPSSKYSVLRSERPGLSGSMKALSKTAHPLRLCSYQATQKRLDPQSRDVLAMIKER